MEKYGCSYTGTVRENFVGYPSLKSVKDLDKSPFGTLDYYLSEGNAPLLQKDTEVDYNLHLHGN